MNKGTATQYFMYAIVFAMSLVENVYFNWNAFPASDAELVCDLLLTVMLFQAVAYGGKS